MKFLFSCSIITGILVSTIPSAVANDFMMQPGLWSVQVLGQSIDGKAVPLPTTAMSANETRMQAAMASMPPAERMRMAAVLSRMQNTFSPDGSIKMCLTAAMLANNTPMINPRNQSCKPTHFQHQGNHVHFDLDCQQGTQKLHGFGDSQIQPGVVQTSTDFVSTGPAGSHHIQSQSRMRFISADCGSVRPIGPQ